MMLLVEGKVRKLGLQLRKSKRQRWQRLNGGKNFRKIVKNTFLDKFLKKTRKARFVPKKWAYFSSKWAGLK